MIENNIGIKTDFSKVHTLFLAYPEGVKDVEHDYTNLCDFYNNLIKIIPKNIHLKIFVKKISIGETVKKLKKNIEYIVNADLSTIWLRDTLGFIGYRRILKPIFKPKYYWGAFEAADHINQNMKIIHSILGYDLEEIPLKWDGGNLVTNGEIGFITERLLNDNKKNYNEKQITEIIKNKLNIEPVFIPELRDDEFAHSDGYLSFINKNTIAVSDFQNKKYKAERNYLKALKRLITNYELDIVLLKELNVSEKIDQKHTAKGNYVNFLKLNKYIIMPIFDLPGLDDYNYNILRKFGKVFTVNCNDIAKYGGLLHCISWVI